MNFEQARHNMVQQQVRTWSVLSQRVLDVLDTVPREVFVPAEYRKLAYTDTPLPLGNDQYMMKPVVEGRTLQALELNSSDKVLEIGTGSAYLTACMARLAGTVTSLEFYDDFVKPARDKLKNQRIKNASVEQGDFFDSEALPQGPFDAVVITGSMRQVPDFAYELLAPGGRLFAILGEDPTMEAQLHIKGQHGIIVESLFDTMLEPLIGAVPAPEFEF